jgi:uncharacterized protein (TIGR02246 family)
MGSLMVLSPGGIGKPRDPAIIAAPAGVLKGAGTPARSAVVSGMSAEYLGATGASRDRPFKEWTMPPLRLVVAGLVLAGAVVCVPLLAQGPPPGSADEAAIRGVVQKYVDAREARDPKAIEALFTSDADQLVSDGTWRKGRDDLVRGMPASSQRTGGRRSITVESVRLLGPDVALVDGRYKQTGLAGGKDRDLWTTILLKRDPKGWRIAAVRNMLPAAPESPAKP